jgi:hypothetical protein
MSKLVPTGLFREEGFGTRYTHFEGFTGNTTGLFEVLLNSTYNLKEGVLGLQIHPTILRDGSL